ncbi:MAG: hypothetical protein ACRD5M_08585 [Candidatus Acidiferrales bacterium]
MLLSIKPANHFQALLIFAVLASVALASLTQRTAAERVKYAAWSLFLFVAIAVGIAWVMYPFSK